MGDFFAELKRRNVIRVGLVYIVVTWLLVQVADILFESFGTPDWVMKTFIALLMMGFPIALIFAWAFEITPEGLKKEKDVDRSQSITQDTGRKLDYAVIVLLAIGLIYFAVNHDWGAEDAAPTTDVAVTTADGRPSIAVLPFVNLSDDASNEYFSDGLSEELLNVLVRIEGLRVPSRTSSFQYKDTELDMRTIADELEVKNVLEGSVRKAGNRVRVTAQLIDATTDEHLWSDTYDRDLEDIFSIQSDIANQIVAALETTLGTAEAVTVDAPTENLEAYQLYLRGRQLWWRRMEHLPGAIEDFQAAVELDPEFARAWAGLAATWSVIDSYLPWDPQQARREARKAALRAIELDPEIAESYSVLASETPVTDWADAEELYLKALSLDPEDSTTRLWYGILLQNAGYVREAREQIEYALELDPAAGIVRTWMTESLYSHGEEEAAIHQAERAADLGFADGHGLLAQIYAMRGEFDLAREHWAKLLEGYGLQVICEDELWAAADDRSLIPAYTSCLEDEGEPEGYWWLHFYDYLFLGMAEEALRDIVSETGWNFQTALWPERHRFLREHPDFQKMIEETGLADYWRDARRCPTNAAPLATPLNVTDGGLLYRAQTPQRGARRRCLHSDRVAAGPGGRYGFPGAAPA